MLKEKIPRSFFSSNSRVCASWTLCSASDWSDALPSSRLAVWRTTLEVSLMTCRLCRILAGAFWDYVEGSLLDMDDALESVVVEVGPYGDIIVGWLQVGGETKIAGILRRGIGGRHAEGVWGGIAVSDVQERCEPG